MRQALRMAVTRRSRWCSRLFMTTQHIAGVQTLIDSGRYQNSRGEGYRTMTKLTEYVKTAEAAEILGVAQNTLRKWAARGDIPMHRNPANGYRLFLRSDLEAFLAQTAKPVNKKMTIRRKAK